MKLKGIFISVFVFILLFLGSLFYYAYQKVNGEELRKFMISSLEEAFPHAKVNVGEVKLKFRSSLNLSVEGLSLTLDGTGNSQSKLFDIQEMGVEIPLLSVLGFEQNITINLGSSYINFAQSKGVSNWSEAVQQTQESAPSRTAMAPTFLANGKFNLKFTDTHLSYDLENIQKGEVLVEYFRVNNLGMNSDAAYELKSDISLKFSKQIVNMGLSLIGEFSPSEFIRQGILKTTSILTIHKMYFPLQDISVPGFKTDIKFDLSNTGDITAKLATVLNNKNRFSALLKTRDEEFSVEDIDLVVYLDELLNVLKMDIPSLRVGDGRIELKGDILLGERFRPNITFLLGPQVKYSYNNELFSGEVKGKYQGRSLVLGVSAKGLKGSLYGDFFIDIDVGRQPMVLSRLEPFKLLVMANDLVLPVDFIQNMLYADAEPEKSEKKMFLLPKGTVDFNLKNISLGGNPLSLTGGITIDSRDLASKDIKVLTSGGGGEVFFQGRLYSEGVKSQFSVVFNDLDLKDVSVFYPKEMGVLEGISSGNVEGTLGSLENKVNYRANLQLKIQNGHWHGMDLERYTQKIVDRLLLVPLLKSEIVGKDLKISNKFQEVSLKGLFTHEQWNLEDYSYRDSGLSFKGSRGRIHLNSVKKKSILPMKVDWKVLQGAMLKNFARGDIPLRLSGLGLELKPDIPYTARKLAKSHVRRRTKKIIRKTIKGNKIQGIIKDLL